VSSVENISAGDKIRLDIDSKGHGIEWVTVKHVGTASSRSTFRGPLTDEDDPGTGLDLTEPLKYDHASNMPFSARGTGISFEPATSFDHSSNEPVMPLSYSLTLNQPLNNNHAIDAVVRDKKVTTAGYQGAQEPSQWFGGPILFPFGGNMVLRNADGNVVDGLNYGELVDPWSAEGYQAVSGAGENGCLAPTPFEYGGGFNGGNGAPAASPDLSTGRYPDGTDYDSNCGDFKVQKTTTLSISSEAGSNNVKVTSTEDFDIGQKIVIGSGADNETSVIALVGTAGGTPVETATKKGATVIPVANVQGFNTGQTITIDNGSKQETAVISSVVFTRRRFNSNSNPADSIMVASPLKYAHRAGVQVSGSGITFANPLTKAHDNGTPIASNIPTPGEPNQYVR